jgi:hypothetical protein
MKLIMAPSAVELRLRKISRRLAQDLVCLTQLANLTFERLDALALVGCRTKAQALVALGLAHPGV